MTNRSSLDPSRYFGGVYPILGPKLPAIAKRLEASGRYGILAGQSWGPPWIPLAAAAAVTERVQLACSVAIAGARSPFETAFCVSVEAREGTTTGISAQDRSRTIQALIAPDAKPQHFVKPGHVFPL
ncbi:LLM class flavin-dependent oxidoreductase, partial [Myxococcota bacterium]|nr:LLM class flavin-dependent oxidoreductase [Myxococcota bacterium]